MNLKLIGVATLGLALGITSNAHAGTFWFPIDNHYPYSANLIVTAVPDLDSTVGDMMTRLYETGEKSNGCIDDSPSYPCTSSYVQDYSIWGYEKDGGGDWDFDGVPYTDGQGGTGHAYLWYDNHTGYDFISTNMGITHSIHAVEDGETCGYVSSYGQMCIEHDLGAAGLYRTWYTHMDNIPAALKANGGNGHSIDRWDYLGDMAGVAPGGGVSPHLHFVTRKYTGGNWVIVDPYGHKPGWPGNTNDDPSNPYLWD